jgi:hypothetical protein
MVALFTRKVLPREKQQFPKIDGTWFFPTRLDRVLRAVGLSLANVVKTPTPFEQPGKEVARCQLAFEATIERVLSQFLQGGAANQESVSRQARDLSRAIGRVLLDDPGESPHINLNMSRESRGHGRGSVLGTKVPFALDRGRVGVGTKEGH